MATGQVGEVWVAGGAALFTSGSVQGGRKGGEDRRRLPQIFCRVSKRHVPHIVSRVGIKGLACKAEWHPMVKWE